MQTSSELLQEILTYLIVFLGFIAIFILPAEYITKLYIDEVRSWGIPGKPSEITLVNHTVFIKTDAQTPQKQVKGKTPKSSTLKSRKTRKVELSKVKAT